LPLRKLSSAEPSLEEVFLKLTSEDEAAGEHERDMAFEEDADTETDKTAEAPAYANYEEEGGDEEGEDDYYVPMFSKTDSDENDDEEGDDE